MARGNLCATLYLFTKGTPNPKVGHLTSGSVLLLHGQMRTRTIAFVGSRQLKKFMYVYKQTCGFHRRERVLFFETGASPALPPDGAEIAIIEEAEASHGRAKQAAAWAKRVISVPMPTMSSFWPFFYIRPPVRLVDRLSSIGHFGDTQIDRLVNERVDSATAIHCYRDAITSLHLGAALAKDLARIRELDRETGFDVEPVVTSLFKSELMFLAPDVPSGRLLAVLARQLYTRMGIQGPALEMATIASTTLADRETLPIHPLVARTYGLSYLDERSSFYWKGSAGVTFDDYIRLSIGPEGGAGTRIPLCSTEADRGDALLNKARAAEAWGSPIEAETGYLANIAAQPNDPDGWIALARFLIQAGRKGEARDAIEAAALLARDYAPMLELKVEIFIKIDDASAALEAASRLVKVAPFRHGANRLLALALRINGQPVAAEMPARKALAEEPDGPHLYHLLAGIFADQGKMDEAIYLLQTALARGLEDAHTRNALAELYEAVDRRADAVALLEDGLDRGQANDQTYSLLGHFRLRAGAFAEAVAAFAIGAEFYPERWDIRKNLLEAEALAASQPGGLLCGNGDSYERPV